MPRSPSPERPYPARRRGGGGAGHHVLPSRCRSPSPPPARRSLRPRRAAAASSRPLVDDFFPYPSSPSSSPPRPQHRTPEPSSSDSGGGGGVVGSSASDRRRRKLKLVVKLSQLPPDQKHRRAPPPPPFSDSSEGEERPPADASGGGEEQVKPPKKRRIESRDDRSRNSEVAGRSDAASAPRTKRLPVPGMARTTPLPDRLTLDMILDKLQKKDTYGVFADPVDLEELPDYNDVVEHPMDFGTVKRKIARNAYRSFEQFEDDVFLICSNAMLYNAPDTVYFRQAHSIQELARKKFQEQRDEAIPTENQVKSEQKVKPISCNRGPIKKPVLRYSEDDLDFLTRKEPIKRPNVKISGDISFKDQVKKPVSRISENLSSFHKERITKPIVRNSENDLSSSFQGEQVKKPICRNSEDGRSSSFQPLKVRKAISRNSESDRNSSFHHMQVKKGISRSSEDDRSSSLPLQQVKKPTSRSSKEDLSSQKSHIRKPVRRNAEPDCSSHTEPFKNLGCKKGEDVGLFSEKLVEDLGCRYGDDLGDSRPKESSRQPNCRDEQDDLGYSCSEGIVKKSDCMNSQDALGSNVSPETIVSAGNGSDGLSVSQANDAELPECTLANGCSDKDISSPVDKVRSEKTDDVSAKDNSAKISLKSFVVDETRRKTYYAPEDQPSSDSDPTFDVFGSEPKELISVGLHSEHSYARSLARFAGSLGARGWRIASERIQQTLPAEVRFGRGWVGEYEPPLPSILAVQDQLRSQVGSDANIQRKASLPRDNERVRPKESINPKDMSLSLHNRITTVNNVIGVTGSLESPEFKPRLFDVTTEPQQRNTDALPLHEKHRGSRNPVKTKRATSEQVRKGRPSSNARAPEVQPQRSECSKGPSSAHDMPAVNKIASQPAHFFQPPEAVRTQQMKKSDPSKSARPHEMAPQRLECPKGAASGVHDMLSHNNSNGHPKPLFQSQEAAAPQPKNEATWVYHGRPGDTKFGTSEKSRPMSNIGFITKNPVNANGFAMNASTQNSMIDHAKSMGAIPGQVNLPNRGFDASRSVFSAFPTAARENQSIPSAPVAQSWISFGASSESKPTIVSPNFHDTSSGWKMPFANVRAPDEPKLSAVPQFFRQPVQVSREIPGQNKGLVIFPQLVQTDFSRSQGQPQWQGLVPHMQQKPNKDMLRPDLNIGFTSPGSPPARQSSGINLEAQQPDLALQL